MMKIFKLILLTFLVQIWVVVKAQESLKSSQDYLDRGQQYSNKLQYDKAIADYTEAIRLDPKYPYAWINRGHAYKYIGEYYKAISDFTNSDTSPQYAAIKNVGDEGGEFVFIKK